MHPAMSLSLRGAQLKVLRPEHLNMALQKNMKGSTGEAMGSRKHGNKPGVGTQQSPSAVLKSLRTSICQSQPPRELPT